MSVCYEPPDIGLFVKCLCQVGYICLDKHNRETYLDPMGYEYGKSL